MRRITGFGSPSRHYARFLDGLREQVNRLIEQSMNEWQRVSQGEALED
jgi:hypothetical protein